MRIRNPNGATAKSSLTALDANTSGNRAKWGIQNSGTNPLGVKIGNTTIWLKACTVNDDGTGGSTEDFGLDVWDGVVTVTGTSPRYNLFEFQR